MRLPRPRSPSADAALDAEARLAALASGPAALGRLGELAAWWCAARGCCPAPMPTRARLVVLAADHGVRYAGITGRDPESGPILAARIAAGASAVSALARALDVGVTVVDVGLAGPVPAGVIDRKLRSGTGDLRDGPAMSRAEAEAAIGVGVALAQEAAAEAVAVLVAGEVGVAGSTAAAAVLSAIAATPGKLTAGRGAGLDDAGVARKVRVIDTALQRERPERGDAVGVLAAVGGLEIAAITGLCLGAAAEGVPVLLDGLSSAAGGLAASALDRDVLPWLLLPHLGAENAHWAMCRLLGREPPLDLRLAQGEGAGAVLGVGLLRAAAALVA